MPRITLASVLIAITVLILPVTPVQAAGGHCSYRQFSPKLRLWFRACEMPATPERCKELVSDYKQQLEYGEGDCIGKGARGVCLVNNNKIMFYQGNPEALAKGCEMMNGTWRPDLLPKQE
jgi:hypothetical protein